MKSSIKAPSQPTQPMSMPSLAEGSAQEEAAEPADYEQHEVENAGDALMKAAHIKKNQPVLHGLAIKHLNQKKDAIHAVVGEAPSSAGGIKSLDQLRKVASEKSKM
jgi:hypothetical protein